MGQPAALPWPQAGSDLENPSCPIPAISTPSRSGAGLKPKPLEREVPAPSWVIILAEGLLMGSLAF